MASHDDAGLRRDETAPGIVYFSRLPPFMKPAKVRYLFSQYGEVKRLFLQPEDPNARKRRKKHGGSKGKNFTEGWLEFADKTIAKSVALTLNNTAVGGKKKSYYHDDIWNIKYLPKFKWSHLSEKIAYQKAVREQRMRTEISQAKREANYYLENVDKKKGFEAMDRRKRKSNSELVNTRLPKSPRKHHSPKHVTTTAMDTNDNCQSRKKISKGLLQKIFTGGTM